jgi:predicted kinase
VAAEGGAVVDATFRRRAHRDAFAAGRGGDDPPPLFVECRAPARILSERASHRVLEAERASDADAEIARRQRTEFEPLDEVGPDAHLVLRTDRSVEILVDEVEAWMDARLARGAE